MPAFFDLGLLLQPQTIETSIGHKGGALSYQRVKRHICNTLKQNSAPFVTTFFDLYRLDRNFPNFTYAQSNLNLDRRLSILNDAFHQDIVRTSGCQSQRFIPYIQPYEFEALLFSDVQTLTTIEEKNWQSATQELKEIRLKAMSPEHINNSPTNKPASHLERTLKNPDYHKVRHGPIAAQKMGLSKIESECAFFAAWIAQLRALSKQV